MPAGGVADRMWTRFRRVLAVGTVLAVLQLLAVSTTAPLVSTDVLAPTTTGVPVVAEALRSVPVAQAGTRLAQGFAGSVSAATALYAHDYRTRYQPMPAQVETQVPSLPLVVGPGKSALADVAVLVLPPPVTTLLPGMTLLDHPQSQYRFEVDTMRRVVVVTVHDRPDVRFEIDYRDNLADPHRMGITPVLVGHRLEGNFHRLQGEMTFPLITPTFEAGRITYTTITNEDDSLLIRFDGGPYANLSPGRDNDELTFLEARINVSASRVQMDLAGLYYVRPAVGAEMSFISETENSTMIVEQNRPWFLTYLDNPTRVEVTDPGYGSYRMRTDVTRLQVQWDGVGTAFELDFDHAYKDRGQANVQTRLVFPTPLER